MTKLLAASGYIGGRATVEVINLDDSNPNLVCDNLPDLLLGLDAAVGTLFRGTSIIICGGYSTGYERRCNSLENGVWKSMASFPDERYASYSAILSATGSENDEIMFVAGGAPYTSSVESFDGKIWNQTIYANMPTPTFGGCMVKINSSMLMSIGGVTASELRKETLFFRTNGLLDPRYFFSEIGIRVE